MISRSLCIATRNTNKIEEIRGVLDALHLQVSSAADYPQCAEVEEDAPTLEGNAEKKARWVAACTGLPSLADDTGLEVDALDGAPGVYSARWAGPDCSYADNNAKLLRELEGVVPARRQARFRCVIAFARPAPNAATRSLAERAASCRVSLHPGVLTGEIIDAARGGHGFGYDPIFFIPALGKTLAELSLAEKNSLSHRARALAAARTALVEYFGAAPQ
jgi:XTP/dITP diphosphohydrolase